MKKIRPLSPHLVIHKSQITSLFSIFHRISGSSLSLLFTLTSLYLYSNFFFQNFLHKSMLNIMVSHSIFISFYYFIIFIFIFHVINGLRHMSWDLGFGLNVKNLVHTSFFVFTLSIILITIIII
jgi:succinate dehydrogenase / fumarate reductase cytochrome b subunit